MRLKATLLLFTLAILFNSCSKQAEISKILFNGIDLDGWIVYGTEKWYVSDGELICESGADEQFRYRRLL